MTENASCGESKSLQDQIRRCVTLFEQLLAASPAEGKKSLPGPTKSDGELDAWEAANGVQLPQGYRAYLREIGDGGPGFTNGTLKALTANDRMSMSFPLTRPWAEYEPWLIEQAEAEGVDECEGTPITWLHRLPEGSQPDDGTICIGHADDGSPYLLVLAGPHADEVWIDGRGYGAGPVCPASFEGMGWDGLTNENIDWSATRFLALLLRWLEEKCSSSR